MSGESTVMPPRKLHDADVVYLYDGSFEGFLCCVFESFAQHEIPFAVWTPQRETATLYPVRDIETDSAKAQRVFSALGRKLGRETEYLVSRDFLSGQEDKELLLIRFLHLAFALGPGTVKRMGHPDVAPLYEMKKESRLGGGQVSGLRPLRGARRDAGCGHPPQKLYPASAAGAFLLPLSGRELHDIRRSPSGGIALSGSTRPSFWSWPRRWSCPRPAPGNRSFRLSGSSSTTRWRSRPATTKRAG